MICKCKMGQCTLLNFYYTRISYRVTFWLFSPCSSHNSTCLTFLSSPALVEQVPLYGREATLQNFQNTFWRRLLLRHTQEILNTHRYQEANQPQDLIIQEPPWSDLSAHSDQILGTFLPPILTLLDTMVGLPNTHSTLPLLSGSHPVLYKWCQLSCKI